MSDYTRHSSTHPSLPLGTAPVVGGGPLPSTYAAIGRRRRARLAVARRRAEARAALL